MKKRIYIALIALMLLASMVLVSCDLSSINVSLNDAGNGASTDASTDDVKNEEEESVLDKLNNQTPFEVYSSFGTKLEAVTGNCTVTSSSKTVSTMVIMNQSIDAVTDISMVVKTNGKNQYSKSVNTTTASGANVEIVMETWYVDGVIYTTDGANKLKLEVTEEEARELVYGDAAGENSIMDIPESWFEGVCFERQKDGNFVMKIDMSGDRMEEAIDRLGISKGIGLEISDIKYEYKLDKTGMLLGCEAKYTLEMAEDDSSSLGSMKSEGVISTTYSDMGTTKEIKAPADADTYTVVTLEDLKAAIGQ